jgi:hypothetical protein
MRVKIVRKERGMKDGQIKNRSVVNLVRCGRVQKYFQRYSFHIHSHRTRFRTKQYHWTRLAVLRPIVYYESRKRELKRRLINEGRCDERQRPFFFPFPKTFFFLPCSAILSVCLCCVYYFICLSGT